MTKKLNANLIRVVNILSDGEFHDGTSMGEKLHMTRSAIWKTMKRLEALQIPVHSVKGKGYVLLETLQLLEQNKIKKKLKNDKIELSIFESVASTNQFLKKQKIQKR